MCKESIQLEIIKKSEITEKAPARSLTEGVITTRSNRMKFRLAVWFVWTLLLDHE